MTTLQAYLAATNPNDLGPADGFTAERRSWRWAEPDVAFGISGTPNNTNGSLNVQAVVGGAWSTSSTRRAPGRHRERPGA